jgi:hypothetical protein
MSSSPIQNDVEMSQALPVLPPLVPSTSIEEIPNFPQEINTESQLWKLFKPKYLLQFKLCTPCMDKLFHYPGKVIKEPASGKVTVKMEMCKECVLVNLKATDLLAPKKK